MEANNMKAMREALEAAERFVNEVGKAAMANELDAVTICQCAASLAGRIAKALAAPARNCDVGAADEWKRRYDKEFGELYHIPTIERVLRWAQMPYESEVKK